MLRVVLMVVVAALLVLGCSSYGPAIEDWAADNDEELISLVIEEVLDSSSYFYRWGGPFGSHSHASPGILARAELSVEGLSFSWEEREPKTEWAATELYSRVEIPFKSSSFTTAEGKRIPNLYGVIIPTVVIGAGRAEEGISLRPWVETIDVDLFRRDLDRQVR